MQACAAWNQHAGSQCRNFPAHWSHSVQRQAAAHGGNKACIEDPIHPSSFQSAKAAFSSKFRQGQEKSIWSTRYLHTAGHGWGEFWHPAFPLRSRATDTAIKKIKLSVGIWLHMASLFGLSLLHSVWLVCCFRFVRFCLFVNMFNVTVVSSCCIHGRATWSLELLGPYKQIGFLRRPDWHIDIP